MNSRLPLTHVAKLARRVFIRSLAYIYVKTTTMDPDWSNSLFSNSVLPCNK